MSACGLSSPPMRGLAFIIAGTVLAFLIEAFHFIRRTHPRRTPIELRRELEMLRNELPVDRYRAPNRLMADAIERRTKRRIAEIERLLDSVN